ncbi:MAG: DVUA0089 family protein, partial [Candidatus Riflebacteria bacterium]|nr:DVUA0089 family protein [Candidatus Riflebacteria bacterium]
MMVRRGFTHGWFVSILALTLGAAGLLAGPQTPQMAADLATLQSASQGQWRVYAGAQEGTVHALWGARATASGRTPDEVAASFLATHARLLGAPVVSSGRKLVRKVTSKTGIHFLYGQYERGLPVHGQAVMVSVDPKLRVQAAVSDCRPLLKIVGTDGKVTRQQALEAASAAVGVQGGLRAPAAAEKVVLPSGPAGTVAWRVQLAVRKPIADWEVMVGAEDGQVLQTRNLLVSYQQGRVFDPNPVVVLGDTSIRDNSNQDLPVFGPAYSTVTLQGLDGSGYLRGQYADALTQQDRSNGNTYPVTRAYEPTQDFIYNRSDQRFEEVMCYYHLDSVQRFIQARGQVSNANNRVTTVNAHEGDFLNAFYSPVTRELYFGDGGGTTDLAEDADVVVHEYGHATQDNQVGGMSYSGETGGIMEGWADFLAGVYSSEKAVNAGGVDPDPACMGEWAWNGRCLRRLDSPKHYPEDLAGEVHEDGEIWAASLWALRNAVGNEVSLRLALESHFLYTSNLTFADGANALLTVDDTLYGGSHRSQIQQVFIARGILDLPGVANISSLSPSSMLNTAPTTLTILGSCFDGVTAVALTGVTTVSLSPFDVTTTTSPAQIVTVVPAGLTPGTYKVAITNAVGTSSRSPAFTIAAPDDHSDTCSLLTTADVVVVGGGAVGGEIQPSSDEDMFSFVVPEAGTYRIYTTLGTLGDSYLWLYDQDCTTVIASDDDSGEGAASLLTRSLTPGTYFLKVHSFAHSGTGTYWLWANASGTPDLQVAIVGPSSAVPGQTLSVTALLTNLGTDATSGQFNTSVALCSDSTGTVSHASGLNTMSSPVMPGASNAVQVTVSMAVPVLQPGGYFLVARADVNNSIGELDETNNSSYAPVTVTTAPADDHANTCSLLTTSDVIVPDGPLATGVIMPSSDEDMFSFDIVEPGTYKLYTELVTLGDSYLYLFASDCTTVIAYDDDSGPGMASEITRALTPGRYYARVYSFGHSGTGSYRVGVILQGGMPDLQVAVHGPTVAARGQTLLATAVVTNLGAGATSGGFYTSVALCSDTSGSVLHTSNTYYWSSAVSPGTSQAVFMPMSLQVPQLQPGNYYLVARADSGNDVGELDETNNSAYAPVSLTTAPVDLSLSWYEYPPSPVYAGSAFSSAVYVYNHGDEAVTGPVKVNAYLSAAVPFDPAQAVLLHSTVLNGLAARSNFYVGATLTAPSTATAGPSTVAWVVDPDGQVTESSKVNNRLEYGTTVVVIAPDSLEPNDSATHASGLGTGLTSATLHTAADVDFFRLFLEAGETVTIQSGAYSGYAPALTCVLVPGGGTVNLYYSFTAKATGDYLLRAQGSPCEYWVDVRKATGVDVHASAFTVTSSSTVSVGSYFYTSWTAGVTAPAGFPVRTVLGFFLSSGAGMGIRYDWYDWTLSSDSPSSRTDWSIGVPYALASGTYYAGFKVDPSDLLAEANEADNQALSPISVLGQPITTSGPDLVAFEQTAPVTAAAAGTYLYASALIRNLGNGWADSSYVGWYLSREPRVTVLDANVGSAWVNSLAPSQAMTATASVYLNQNLQAGTYYLGAIADFYGYVAESNEQNNATTRTVAVTVVPVAARPDLVMLGVDGPSSARPGSQIVVSAVVANPTTIPVTDVAVRWTLLNPQFHSFYDLGDVSVSVGAGQTTTVFGTFTAPYGPASGSYSLQANVDPNGTVAELSDDNNYLTAGQQVRFDVVDDHPDTVAALGPTEAIAVGGLPAAGAIEQYGDRDLFYFDIGTTGTYRVYTTTGTLRDSYLSLLDRDGTTVLATDDNSGGNYRAQLAFNFTIPGRYYARVEPPPWNYNYGSYGLGVRLRGTPDLVVSVAAPPTLPKEEANVVWVTLSNLGNDDAQGGFYTSLALTGVATGSSSYWSTDLWQSAPVSPGASQAVAVPVTVRLPYSLLPGAYNLVARVDTWGNVVELDETNNTSIQPTWVPTAALDLDAVWYSVPSVLYAGSSFESSAYARNLGDTDLASPVHFTEYLSPGSTFDRARAMALHDVVISGLSARSQQYYSSSAVLPATVPPGSYTLAWMVDSTGAVTESREWNNAATYPVTVIRILPDPFEPNDSIATASLLGTGLTSATLSTVTDVDYFKLHLEVGETVTLGLQATSGWTPSFSFASVPGGRTLDPYRSFTARQTGDYILQVYGSPCEYSLDFQKATGVDVYAAGFTVTNTSTVSAGSYIYTSWSAGVVAPASFPVRTYLRFFISDSAEGANGSYSEYEQWLSAGSPIGSSSWSMYVPGALASGTYYAGLKIDSRDALAEAKETDNLRSIPISVVGPPVTTGGPDLVAVNQTLPVTAVEAGSYVQAAALISNPGDQTAQYSYTGWYLSSEPRISTLDRHLASSYTPSLAPLQSTSMSSSLFIPLDVLPGTYYLGAIADIHGYVAESNEGNNATTAPTQLVVRAPTPLPDPAAIAVSAPDHLEMGSPTLVSATVTNLSTTVASQVEVGFYLSTDSNVNPGDTFLGVGTISVLGSEATTTVIVTVTAPAGLATGAYYLGAIVDPSGRLVEASESNNVALLAGTVRLDSALDDHPNRASDTTTSDRIEINGAAATGNVELAGDADFFYFDVTRPGQFVCFTQLVTMRDSYLYLYDRDGTTVLTQDDDSGGSLSSRIVWNLTVPGRYFLMVREYSSSRTGTYRVLVTGTEQSTPDFRVDSVRDPGTLYSGQPQWFEALVSNAGNGLSTTVAVDFYLRDSATSGQLVNILLGSTTASSIASGQGQWVGVGSTLPTTLATGAYRLEVAVDPRNAVPESNETNNTALAEVWVLHLGPDAYEPNETAEAAIRIGPGHYDLTLQAGDNDFFTVDLNAGDTLSVVARCAPNNYLWLQLTEPDGRSSAGSAVAGLAGVTRTARTAGPHVVYAGGSIGTYSLYVFIARAGSLVDVAVSNVQSQQTTVAAGAYAEVSVTCANATSIPVAFSLSGVLSRDAVYDDLDRPILRWSFTPVEPYQPAVFSSTFRMPPVEPGAYYLVMAADPLNDIVETDELNNFGNLQVLAFRDEASGQAPDLQVTQFVGPSTASIGSGFQVTAVVSNAGLRGAGSFQVAVKLSQTPILDGLSAELGNWWVSELASGDTVTVTPWAWLPSTVGSGTYYLGVLADSDANVLETNEGNNARQLAAPFTVTQPSLPDFVAQSVRPLVTSTGLGNELLLSAEIGNSGLLNGCSSVQFVLSPDPVISETDHRLAWVPFCLDAAGTLSLRTTGWVTGTLPEGTYYVGMIVNPQSAGACAEVTRANNIAICTAPVQILARDDHPNTAAQVRLDYRDQVSVTTSGTSTGTAYGEVERAGDVDYFYFTARTPGLYTIETRLYTLSDSVLYLYGRDGVTQLGYNDDASGLGAASRIAYDVTVTGRYFVMVRHNSPTGTGRYGLRVQGPSQAAPDLVADLSGIYGTAYVGEQFWPSATVRNQGDLTAGSFAVDFYLSRDATRPATGDPYLGRAKFDGQVWPGSSVWTQLGTSVPAVTPATYYVRTVVDAANQVAEADEENNLLAQPLRIEAIASDAFEPNETTDQAAQLPLGHQTLSIQAVAPTTGTTSSAYDTDCFRADLLEGETLSLKLSRRDGRWVDLLVTTPDGKVYRGVRSWYSGQTAAELAIGRTLTARQAGRYFITINGNVGLYYLDAAKLPVGQTGRLVSTFHQAPTTVAAANSQLVSWSVGYEGTTSPVPVHFWTQLLISEDTAASSDDQWTWHMGELDVRSGEVRNLSAWAWLPALAPGNYYLIASADFENSFGDPADGRNAVWAFSSDPATGTTSPADLVAVDLYAPPVARQGRTCQFTGVLANQGQQASGCFSVRFVLSKDSAVTNLDRYLGDSYVCSMAAGETRTVTVSAYVDSSITTGQYSLGMIADLDNVIAESNERNNVWARPILVDAELPTADLTVNWVSGPRIANRGHSVSLSASVYNAGNGPTTDGVTFTNRFELSRGPLPGTTGSDQVWWLADQQMAPLAAGESRSLEVLAPIPQVVDVGWYYVRLSADAYSQVEETSESNNVGFYQMEVADFGPSSLSVAPAPPVTLSMRVPGPLRLMLPVSNASGSATAEVLSAQLRYSNPAVVASWVTQPSTGGLMVYGGSSTYLSFDVSAASTAAIGWTTGRVEVWGRDTVSGVTCTASGFAGVVQVVGNQPPTVTAGGNSRVYPGTEVVLNGWAQDSDGTVSSLVWSQASGPAGAAAVVFTSVEYGRARFIAPQTPGVYVFTLTATDDAGTQATASTLVEVRVADMEDTVVETLAGGGCGSPHSGGAATAAALDTDFAAFPDAAGNLYIAEHYSGRIDRVDALSGRIEVLAGQGSWGYSADGTASRNAYLNGPGGMLLDRNGDVLVSEFAGHRVRRLDLASGKLYSVAGGARTTSTTEAGEHGDGGPAMTATLMYPTGLSYGPGGYLYIIDRGHSRIRRILANGTIETFGSARDIPV